MANLSSDFSLQPPGNTELSSNLTCSRCGAEIGRLVVVGDDELLQVGNLLVVELHGNCVQCGEGFHYSLSERRLERLINHIKQRRS